MDESFFAPPDGFEGLALTHIIELPRDLRIDGGFRMFRLAERDDSVFVGWTGEMLRAFAQHDDLPAGTRPDLRLIFRRVRVRTQVPLEAADRAFADWKRPLMNGRNWRRRQRQLRTMIRGGLSIPVTVVAATSFISIENWSAGRDEQEDVLDHEFSRQLTFLNDEILSLGLLTGDDHLVPVARGDLPRLCPFIIEAFPATSRRRVGTSGLREVHELQPAFISDEPYSRDTVVAATELATRYAAGEEPFFMFYELLVRARSSAAAYRTAEVATALGTAAEVLVSVVIREASILLGEPADRRDRILDAPFRSRLRDRIGRYAHVEVDLDDEDNVFGRWLADEYVLRNRVIHEGYRPTLEEAAAALEATYKLTIAIRRGLLSARRLPRLESYSGSTSEML